MQEKVIFDTNIYPIVV